MPEGPEIYLAADFINSVSKGRIFSEIRKSTVSKHSEISWPVGNEFTISAQSRGKELLMKLTPNGNYSKNISCRSILFQFGMTGKFVFLPVDEMPKHSHLMFFTSDKLNALIFEDYRRFVCEVLLDQRFFNGVGNYLRAEILYRAGIPPFVSARDALSGSNSGLLLDLCRTIPMEVMEMRNGKYSDKDYWYAKFEAWLRCYMNPKMKNLRDHNNRTIWFNGSPGPLAPAVAKSRKPPGSSKKKEVSNDVKDENVAVKSIVKTEKSVVKTEKSALKIKKTALRAKKSVMKTENSAVKTEKTVVKMEYEEIYEQMENKSKKSIFRAANRVSSGRTHIMTTRSQLFVGKLE